MRRIVPLTFLKAEFTDNKLGLDILVKIKIAVNSDNIILTDITRLSTRLSLTTVHNNHLRVQVVHNYPTSIKNDTLIAIMEMHSNVFGD